MMKHVPCGRISQSLEKHARAQDPLRLFGKGIWGMDDMVTHSISPFPENGSALGAGLDRRDGKTHAHPGRKGDMFSLKTL